MIQPFGVGRPIYTFVKTPGLLKEKKILFIFYLIQTHYILTVNILYGHYTYILT